MPRSLMRALTAALVVGGCAIIVAACGSSNDNKSSGGFASGTPVSGQKKGGTLKVLSTSDVDYIDPGQAYYQLTYQITYATQRPLYSYKPEDSVKQVPDLAASDPQVSADGKTVTIKIRSGVKFSPPVNRVVTSKDVKYALTRGFYPSVATGYVGSYLGDLVGAKAVAAGNAKDIPGIETPDDQTLVLKFTKGVGATAAQSLALPYSAPVPEEYAKPFDAKKTSDYGFHQVATGPYMIKNDSSGNINKVGYTPGRKIILVRNPNWDGKATGDYRPAYVDGVDWTVGAEPVVAGRQILTGTNLVNGDTPASATIKLAATKHKSQLSLAPLGNRYIALNTAIAPFDNENLRKAVNAGIDRTALQLTRGGKIVGDIASHYLPPGSPGFEEAGGVKGPNLDFLAKPEGDPKLAAEYMKKAGYPSGKYTGPAILMVGDNTDPASKTAQVVLQQLQKLGFKVTFRSVSHDAMYTTFCGTPKRKVQVCPNVGWVPDFNDGFAYLYPSFNGKEIKAQQNSNWPQLNDPAINAAMDKAALISDPGQRNKAWGEIDKQITATAAAVPWFWDNTPNIESKNVQGVIAKWNAAWDLSFVSIK